MRLMLYPQMSTNVDKQENTANVVGLQLLIIIYQIDVVLMPRSFFTVCMLLSSVPMEDVFKYGRPKL